MKLFARSKPKISVQSTKKDGYSGWVKCTECNEMVHANDLQENKHCCPKCDHHYRLTGLQRIQLLAEDQLMDFACKRGLSHGRIICLALCYNGVGKWATVLKSGDCSSYGLLNCKARQDICGQLVVWPCGGETSAPAHPCARGGTVHPVHKKGPAGV